MFSKNPEAVAYRMQQGERLRQNPEMISEDFVRQPDRGMPGGGIWGGPPGGFDQNQFQIPGGGGQFQTPGMVPEDFGQQFSGPQANDPRIQALQEALLNMVAARSGNNIGPPGAGGQRIVPFGEGM